MTLMSERAHELILESPSTMFLLKEKRQTPILMLLTMMYQDSINVDSSASLMLNSNVAMMLVSNLPYRLKTTQDFLRLKISNRGNTA